MLDWNTWNHQTVQKKQKNKKKKQLRLIWKRYLQNTFTNYIFDIYVKTGFGIK